MPIQFQRRSRRGEEAFRQWYTELREQYLPLIHWKVGQRLSDPALLEDAIQQTFAELLRRPQCLGELGTPQAAAFVTLVAECRAIDLLRRQSRAPIPVEDEELERAAPVEREGCGLRECLEALREDDRRLVLLHWHYGYSAAEIARLEGLPTETAKKRIQRAKRRLEILCREENVL